MLYPDQGFSVRYGCTYENGELEAHTFSHALGNNTLFSFDEYDSCNERFAKWETDLAAFLGPSCTLNQVWGKNWKDNTE